MHTFKRLTLFFVLSMSSNFVMADQAPSKDEFHACLDHALLSGDDSRTVAELKQACFYGESDERQSEDVDQAVSDDISIPDLNTEETSELSALDQRLLEEQITQDAAFVMTPHRQNYILIGTYNDAPNQAPFIAQNLYPEVDKPLTEEEVKMQISFKVPLNKGSLWLEGDNLYFGFTLKSFWQLYNERLSAPFRETNYRPELFYQAPLKWQFMGGDFFGRVGFEHESNGRSQLLSRSWNRIYVGLGYQRDNWAMYLQPWYRLPESDKVDDGDPNTPPPASGDDNPDISDFYGHYEFLAVYKNGDDQFSSRLRQNFDTGKGAIELGYSFPLHHRIKGYVQYYYGYGESLIDYDHRVNRIGIGVLLTDFL